MKLRTMSLAVLLCILVLAVIVTSPVSALAQVTHREFIYTANFADNTVSGFSLNLANGKATEVPGSPFSSGIGPVSITHSPDGRFVYVAVNSQFAGGPCGNNNGELISYSVDPHTGALTLLDDVVLSGICSTGITIDPTGNFVYVASFPFDGPKVGIIDGFQASNGHLIPLAGTPFASTIEVSSGQNPAIEHLAITPDGKVLYASNPNDSRGILIFDRDATTGALTFRTAFETGSPFTPIAITPSGGFLIALGDMFLGFGQPGIFEFAIAVNGDLNPVPGSPFALPGGFGSSVGISPGGEFVASLGRGISTFRENGQGSLSLVPGSPFGNVTGLDITFDPLGRFVLVSGTVFRINSKTGVLTKVSNFTSGGGADAITVVRTSKTSDHP